MNKHILSIIIIVSVVIICSLFIGLQTHKINKLCEISYNTALQLDNFTLDSDTAIDTIHYAYIVLKTESDHIAIPIKNIENRQVDNQKSIIELNSLKRYIIDSNSLSFLFQIISVLVLGIGVVILQKGSELRKEMEKEYIKLKNNSEDNLKKVKENSDKILKTSYINNKTQIIYIYSSLLKDTDIEDQQLFRDNSRHISKINESVHEIKSYLDDGKYKKFEKNLLFSSINQLKDCKTFYRILKGHPYYGCVIKDINHLIIKLEKYLK